MKEDTLALTLSLKLKSKCTLSNSILKRCLRIPEEVVAPTNIKLQSDLTYEEKPIRVLEKMERVTQSKVIKFYKVVWNNHSEQDATWEQEDYLHEVYLAFCEEW